MLLNEIKIKNFLSHEDTEIHFQENEKILVDGKSGSGKSAITEAILFALYGKGRGETRSLIRKGSKSGATVSLRLDDGSKSFIITRSISATGKNTLSCTSNNEGSKFLPIEKTGIKEIQEWIEKDLLKASYELFTNSIAYPQENENSFVKATASRRKDLLLEIVNAGTFEGLYEKAKTALNSNKVESAVSLEKITNLKNSIEEYDRIIAKKEGFEKENADAVKEVEEYTAQEKVLELRLNGFSQITRQIADQNKIKDMLNVSIKKIDDQLRQNQIEKIDHENTDIKTRRLEVEESKELAKVITSIEQELKDNSVIQQRINAHLSNRPFVYDYTKELEEINKRLIALMKETGKCPAGDQCPFLLPVRGQIDYLTEQITEKSNKEVSERDAFERWEKEFKALPVPKDTNVLYKKQEETKKKIESLSGSIEIVNKYDAFENILGEMNTQEIALKMERDDHSKEILSIDVTVGQLEQEARSFDCNTINIDLSKVRIRKNGAQRLAQETATSIAIATNAQLVRKDASTVLLELQKGIKKSEEDVESLELLKEALSPRGVKAVIIDYLIPQFEERINAVLSQMSEFRIRLDTQKATVDEEGLKEGLFITVLNDYGEQFPFASYSGGEKIKITIAISEALASLIPGVGFRIMDEAITSLDNESTSAFVNVLLKLQDKFQQFICISHISEVKDVFEKRITITKKNGVSKVTTYEKN